jgi:hypothetical protein
MNEQQKLKQARLKRLSRLGELLYDSIEHENDKRELELLYELAAAAKLVFEGVEEFDPDLGLNLLLLCKLKKDLVEGRGEGLEEGIEMYRSAAQQALERLRADL